jgi:hypothetical protein
VDWGVHRNTSFRFSIVTRDLAGDEIARVDSTLYLLKHRKLKHNSDGLFQSASVSIISI